MQAAWPSLFVLYATETRTITVTHIADEVASAEAAADAERAAKGETMSMSE